MSTPASDLKIPELEIFRSRLAISGYLKYQARVCLGIFRIFTWWEIDNYLKSKFATKIQKLLLSWYFKLFLRDFSSIRFKYAVWVHEQRCAENGNQWEFPFSFPPFPWILGMGMEVWVVALFSPYAGIREWEWVFAGNPEFPWEFPKNIFHRKIT